MTKFGHLGRGLVVATALLGSAASASAAPMLFTLEGETFNDLSASVLFSYAGLTNTSGRVDISVTNTSARRCCRMIRGSRALRSTCRARRP